MGQHSRLCMQLLHPHRQIRQSCQTSDEVYNCWFKLDVHHPAADAEDVAGEKEATDAPPSLPVSHQHICRSSSLATSSTVDAAWMLLRGDRSSCFQQIPSLPQHQHLMCTRPLAEVPPPRPTPTHPQTLACSFSSSRTNSLLSTSTRVLNCCPILMNLHNIARCSSRWQPGVKQ
jgi:hypothetical protein